MQTVVNTAGQLTDGGVRHSTDQNYSIREVKNLEEFRALKTLWNYIASSEPYFYPFLCFEWMEVFLDHFLGKDDLLVLLVFRGQDPVCIAPFVLRRDRCKGIQTRKIELIGNFYCHVRNILFHNMTTQQKEHIFSLLIDYLLRTKEWDVIDLQSLPEEKFEFESMQTAAEKAGLVYQEYPCFGNWYLDGIEYDSGRYLETLSSNICNNAKRYRKALERKGTLTRVLVTDGSKEKIDRFLDDYYSVYWESWKKTEADRTFHRDIATFACQKGWLRLGFLYFNGEPIAAQYWLVHGGVAHNLKLLFKEKFRKYVPGIILTIEVIRHLIDCDKVSALDFGIGDDPFKKDWMPKRRERKGVLICNKTVKGRVVALLIERVLPIVNKHKYLRQMKSLLRDSIYGRSVKKWPHL